MIEKYILFGDEAEVVAIKIDLRNDRIIIGGYSRFRLFMEKIISGYFGMKVPFLLSENIQVNKIRYKFTLSKKYFDIAIEMVKHCTGHISAARKKCRIYSVNRANSWGVKNRHYVLNATRSRSSVRGAAFIVIMPAGGSVSSHPSVSTWVFAWPMRNTSVDVGTYA